MRTARSSRLAIAAVTLVAAVAAVAALAAPAAAHPVCGTPARIPTFRPVPARPHAVARAADGDKLDRDPFGPHVVRTSANFAVRWHDATITDAQAQVVLDELETAWTLYTGAFGQTPPFGTDTYRLNVYLSTVTDSPSIDFGGGYAGQDDEGFPYVVLSTDLFTTGDDWLRDTAAHELYHDFQMSLGGFTGATSMWWWEATADWAAQEALPDEPTAYLFDGAFALAEELSMFFYGDPFGTDAAVTGLHQYGASILPKYFTETLGDRDLVVASWEQAAPGDDALDAFFAQFAADPREVADRFGEFAAHTARWDVPHAAEILVGVNQFAAAYPDRPRLDLTIGADGTDWTAVRAGAELHAWGYNLIELARPADGVVAIDLAADTAAVPVEWRATLVREVRGVPTYTPIAVATGAIGHATATLAADEPRAWLVVAAVAATRDDRTTFPYRVRVNRVDPDPDPQPDPDPDPGTDGGCNAAGAGGATGAPGIIVVGVAAIFASRRRRSRR